MKDHFQFFLYFLVNQTHKHKTQTQLWTNTNPKVSFSSSHRLFLFLYLTNLPSSLANPKLSLYNPHLNPPMAKAQIGLHSQSLYSLPIPVSHPLSLDLYMVQNSPSKLKIWTQQWWDVIHFRIYNFYKGFERDTLEGSHLCLCRRKKKTNFFLPWVKTNLVG